MSKYLVIFIISDIVDQYIGHWTGWLWGDRKDAINQAYEDLCKSGGWVDGLTIARQVWLDDVENSPTIVEEID